MELGKLKQYLGIGDNEQDAFLKFIMEDTEEIILDYCNIDQIPDGLLNTSYRMAMDLYRNENVGHGEDAVSVSSITIGDTSTSFKQTADDSFKDSVLKNYSKILNRYRKVGFRRRKQ